MIKGSMRIPMFAFSKRKVVNQKQTFKLLEALKMAREASKRRFDETIDF